MSCDYHSYQISKSDNCGDVIKKSLEKYDIVDTTATYDIYQLLNKGKGNVNVMSLIMLCCRVLVIIPNDSIVYYALSNDTTPPILHLKSK